MTAKAAAARARAKKIEAETLERMAATYRQFVYACRGEVPPGYCYELSPVARDEWKTQSKAAATTLGLRNEKG